MTFGKVCILGMGYIGLPTAAVLASLEIEVVGVDTVQRVVDGINRGQVHFFEPELESAVRSAVAGGRLRANTTPENADAYIIAVPTPFHNDHEPDLSFVEAAAISLAPVLTQGNLIILESTSPVGTTERVAELLAGLRPDLRFPGGDDSKIDVHLAYCPERVLPGKMMHELISNDRVVGGLSAQCANLASDLYRMFVHGTCLETSARTAEMCKLAENSFRDVNIAFANELSLLCDRLHIDVWELIHLANRHPRVEILRPGPGVGGHCIAVDPWFLVSSAPDISPLIRTAREVNDGKPGWVIDKVRAAIAEIRSEAGRPLQIAVLGLAFKADVDDLRESPALEIAEAIGKFSDVSPLFVEPHINELPSKLAGLGSLSSLDDALTRSDIVVLLVDHSSFRALDPSRLDGKCVIDTRGVWSA